MCLLKLAASARLPNEARLMIGESLGVFRRRIILDQITQVPFHEVRLATDYTSNNEPSVIRAIVTFKCAMMLVDGISRRQIAESYELIVDMQKFATWDDTKRCFLELDAFRTGTKYVYKKAITAPYLRIRHFEASRPGNDMAHRITPLPGFMFAHTTKRQRHDDKDWQPVPDKAEIRQKCENYTSMLRNLMSVIQEYLLLSDDEDKPGGYERQKDNRICIWVQETWL